MEAQDFEMPSPKRQRTDSPMEVAAPQESQGVVGNNTNKEEVKDLKQEQQQVPDVLDFLMQHVESESNPQEVTPISTQTLATEQSVAAPSSNAVATESSSVPLSEDAIVKTVLNDQDTGISEPVNAKTLVQGSVAQNETAPAPAPAPAETSAEIPANSLQQDAEPAAAVTDSVMTTEQEQPVEAREWETDSSPYSSDSSDTTDSSDEDSDDDEDDDADPYVLLDPMEQARILMAEDGGAGGDSDDEGAQIRTTKAANGIRTINEKPEAILPKPDVVVTSSTPIEELGRVTFFVENTLLITAKTSGEYQVLESGSVLCLGAPTYAVIGAVAETLGRVEEPLYTVRFASEADVRETFGLNAPAAIVKEGTEPQSASVQEPGPSKPQTDLAATLKNTPIFYVKSHSTFVFTQPLRSAKGTDASNIHDEEVGEDEQEFSDDEAEAEYKRVQKLKKKGIDPSTVPPPASRGRGGSYRGGRGQRGGSSYGGSDYTTQPDAVMNYDDAPVDDGEVDYTPLRRPDAFQQPQQDYSPQTDRQQGRDRGRGRGGRGNFNPRGRGAGGRGRGNYQNQTQPQRNSYNDAQNYNNASYNTNTYNQPTSMYPTFQPQMPSADFSFQAQAQSQWAQYHANQNQQYQQQQQQQYGGQPGMPNFNAEALAQVQRQLEEMRRQGQGYQ